MAAGALSSPGRSPRPPRVRPALLAGLRARLHRGALDRDLGAGIAVWRSPEHAARASQLTSRRHRRRLADALDHVVMAVNSPIAEQAPGAVPPARSSVRASASRITALAALLRSDAPVAAAGIVRLENLLRDGAGPVYAPGPPEDLATALSLAAQWLHVGE
ncbi:MAG TPA: hypothetical protein VE571_06915 [Solirubrobacteraceae bacterium]|jgi:hypothetical protein|nr:hypothetical protein [Solirubrobacteraceae bacterium]